MLGCAAHAMCGGPENLDWISGPDDGPIGAGAVSIRERAEWARIALHAHIYAGRSWF